jgi:hypothetical protein
MADVEVLEQTEDHVEVEKGKSPEGDPPVRFNVTSYGWNVM